MENHRKQLKMQNLHALLNEDLCQTLKQLAEALEVDQGTISRRLHAMVKI